MDPLAAERQFFNALLGARWESLDQVLGDDFLLIAVMSGSEVTKPVLLDAVASGNLRFESIDVLESKVRLYASTAVVTGHTQNAVPFGETPFSAIAAGTPMSISNSRAAGGSSLLKAPRLLPELQCPLAF